LRDRDPVEDGVEAPVPAAVEAVAHPPRAGGFQGRHHGVDRELRVGGEAAAGAEDAGERPGGQEADAAQPGQRDEAGAYLDALTRTLWVWEAATLDPRYLAGLRRRWPGWGVRGHTEGLVRQVALSGRDPDAVPGLVVPEAQTIAELVQELTLAFGYDGGTEVPRIADRIRAEDGPDTQIEINPAALGRHVPALSAAARRRIMHDLFGTDSTDLTPSR
jgi:hypothetical protein